MKVVMLLQTPKLSDPWQPTAATRLRIQHRQNQLLIYANSDLHECLSFTVLFLFITEAELLTSSVFNCSCDLASESIGWQSGHYGHRGLVS